MSISKAALKRVMKGITAPMWAAADTPATRKASYSKTLNLVKNNNVIEKVTPEELKQSSKLAEFFDAEAESAAKLGEQSQAVFRRIKPGYETTQIARDAGVDPVRHMDPLNFNNSIVKTYAEYGKSPDKAYEMLADRVNNLSRFLDAEHMDDPTFYKTFNEILTLADISLPRPVLNVALSTASAREAPVGEVLRLIRVAMHVKVKDGAAFFDLEDAVAKGFNPKDNFAINTGHALAGAVNDPDFLAKTHVGQSGKTSAYTLNREDPGNPFVYVGDTVDQQGQVLSHADKAHFSADTASAKSARNNQLPGRIGASIAGINPSAFQTNTWGPIRMGYLPARPRGIGAAFMNKEGETLLDLLQGVTIRDEVAELADTNFQRLVKDVKSGANTNWEEGPGGLIRPNRTRPELILPAKDRNANNLRMQTLAHDAAAEVGQQLGGKFNDPRAYALAMILGGGAYGANQMRTGDHRQDALGRLVA
jgi:hypothetical protein